MSSFENLKGEGRSSLNSFLSDRYMGNVTIVARIFVDDPAQLPTLKEKIAEKGMRVADARIEEVGFGVKFLRVLIVMPDAEGGDVEDKLRRIQGVSQVQIDDVSLL